jgi:hypothetical protein
MGLASALGAIGQYLRADFSSSIAFWHKGEAMSVLVGALAAFVITVVGIFGFQIRFGFDTAQFWTIAVAAYFLVLLLLVTPFRMWNEQRLRIDSFEREREPKIAISDPIGMAFPKVHANQHVRRTFCVHIENLSVCHLSNCHVAVAQFINRRKEREIDSGYVFRLYRDRFSSETEHDFQQSFDLNGMGDVASIAIVSLDERSSDAPVIMQYATQHTSTNFHRLSRALFPHWLTVRVTAANMAVPVTKSFCIEVTTDGFLTMETVQNFSKSDGADFT